MEITVIKGTISVNSAVFDVYTGFMTAKEVKEYAKVPSFPKTKSNYDIANSLHSVPVDEWQRPEDEDKVNKIADLYSLPTDDNVMPNGILLGVNVDALEPEGDATGSVCVIEPLVVGPGSGTPVPDVYTLRLGIVGGLAPLLILDGQHRVAGLKISSQKDQPIPFVLCKDGFVASKLAEIFTHVTTEATPMKALHKAWMQYSFELGQFKSPARQNAARTAIHLCTDDGTFQKKIQFNDYQEISADTTRGGFNQGEFNFIGWTKTVSDQYYSKFSDPSLYPDPAKVAAAITTSIDAMRECTEDHRNSKFFTPKSHKILCSTFLRALLNFIAKDNTRLTLTKEQWEKFYKGPGRAWDKVRWDLPYVLNVGQNAADLQISKHVASNCFKAFFEKPADLMGLRMHQYLAGDGGHVIVKAYRAKADGKPDKTPSSVWEQTVTSSTPITINGDGVDREYIHFASSSPNWKLKRARDPDHSDEPLLPGLVRKSVTFHLPSEFPGKTEKNVRIARHSYHSSSMRQLDITINW